MDFGESAMVGTNQVMDGSVCDRIDEVEHREVDGLELIACRSVQYE